MTARFLILLLSGMAVLWGQRVTGRMSANIRGGGGEGKCTIEVWVDDVAEVEIMGRNAQIRTINGSPASFRRFECNQEMPFNPSGFRFKGIDGRGRQELVSQPGGRRPAVIRIEDSKGGGEGYTFDIFWSGGSGFGGGGGFGGGSGGGGGFFDTGSGSGTGVGGGYGGRGNRGGGWDNSGSGWGSGSGWSNNEFNFTGGRRAAGGYRDRNGQFRRLDTARVTINNSGYVNVSFDTDQGRFEFGGRIDRRDNRRVYANVSGSGMSGLMEMEMSAQDRISRITVREIDLNWSN